MQWAHGRCYTLVQIIEAGLALPPVLVSMSSLYSAPELQRSGVATDPPLHRTLREQQILLDSAGVGIVFLRQRSVVRCNQRYAEIFGYPSPARLVGLNTEAFYPDREAFRELGRSAYPVLAQGQSFRVERQLRRSDGTLFWGSLTGRLINPHDTTEGSIWILDDIDEQKRAQAALSAAEREKQLLFDSAMVGIVFLRDRRLTRCNDHFEQMLGFQPGELMGSSSRRWYASDEAWEEVGRRCYPGLASGQSYEGEVELCRKDGTPVICEVRSKSIDPADPSQGSIWITMDITERKQAQAALEGRPIPPLPPLAERWDTAVRQIELAVADKGEHIALLEARKQLCWYLKGVSHANYYKEQIVRLTTLEELYRVAAGVRRDLR